MVHTHEENRIREKLVLQEEKDNYQLCIKMHKLNVSMHKTSLIKKAMKASSSGESINIEHEDRLAEVLSLHSKGLLQY
jgi:hypothetical protein